MSGDVQPRKRKDKKRKKDDLGVSEPRGTAAALGDGDVFIHSQHEHGTGGHWCAKVVFFSLLAILVGLVGLIILENRGLSELEANAVQSQYSGVLEGWLEDAPEDDHHDEHTLELNHHDDEDDGDHEVGQSEEAEDDGHDEENESDEDDDHDEENGHDEDDEENYPDQDDEEDEETLNEDDDDGENGSQEQDLEANDEDEDLPYRKYYQDSQVARQDDDDDDDDYNNDQNDDDEDEKDQNDIDDDQEDDENEIDRNGNDNDEEDDDDDGDNDEDDNEDDERNNQSVENDVDGQENDDNDEENEIKDDARDNEAESQEQDKEDDDEHEEEEDVSLEIEKIEQEASNEEPISTELPALPEPDDDDDDEKALESAEEDGADTDVAGDDTDADDDDDGDDFLDADGDVPVERITAPSGAPFDEVEEEVSSEKPADTLEDEEEYEKQQEELRREEAQASHMWLKLSVGAALLAATHALVRRAASSSDAPNTEESPSREETPTVDRRMTLIPEEPTESVPIRKVQDRPVVQEVAKHIPSITKSPPTFEDSEEELEEEEQKEEPVVSKIVQAAQSEKAAKEELYSDEGEAEDDEVEDEEVEKPGPQVAKQPSPEPEEDVSDDVEIIDDEIEEEEVLEEEISDVDDEELLSRLEAKYGRLPEPERPGRPQRHKDGGNSLDEWPGEPSDAYWRQQLDQAEQEYNQGSWLAAAERASAKQLASSARARSVVAKSLDAAAEEKRDNTLLGRAIAAYLELLKMNERLSDEKLLQVTERAINRIQFRGNYLNAEPVYRLLIRRFPNNPAHRTNLTVSFLMANRADLAEEVLKETLKKWPDDRLALAQYGFVLKTQHNRLEEAAEYLEKALKSDTGPATEPRYYYHLGDTLLLLGRFKEAHEVHKRGAVHGHFLSPSQRSLYNVPRLKGRPWWKVHDTPYVKLIRSLEKSWQDILKEGLAAKALYEEEKEGLREKGEWSQLDLFVRGREVPGRCLRAPVTCSVVKAEVAAAGCRRGQIKFSSMEPGTHVRPHVGPTNCRLRMHLGLSNTKDTFLRVDQETRQWKEGSVLIFDDSFEHEVWHNGSGSRLVLIVDVWHPELTAHERRTLPAI